MLNMWMRMPLVFAGGIRFLHRNRYNGSCQLMAVSVATFSCCLSRLHFGLAQERMKQGLTEVLYLFLF